MTRGGRASIMRTLFSASHRRAQGRMPVCSRCILHSCAVGSAHGINAFRALESTHSGHVRGEEGSRGLRPSERARVPRGRECPRSQIRSGWQRRETHLAAVETAIELSARLVLHTLVDNPPRGGCRCPGKMAQGTAVVARGGRGLGCCLGDAAQHARGRGHLRVLVGARRGAGAAAGKPNVERGREGRRDASESWQHPAGMRENTIRRAREREAERASE